MSLKPSEESALFYADPPPQTGNVHDVVRWADLLFRRLEAFVRRPEFNGVVFSLLEPTAVEEFKAEDGLMVYVGAGVFGPNEGLYLREGGTWKKIT
jgi:hypothetical protein